MQNPTEIADISGLKLKRCRRCVMDLDSDMFKTGRCRVCNSCKRAYKNAQKKKCVTASMILWRTRHNAKWRGKTFNLTVEQFKEIRGRPCYYCDGLLGALPKRQGGLDRIDNMRGYEVGNVLPCCRTCNSTRNLNFTVEETKAMIGTVIKMRGLKGAI
jgi:hypothetical protein